MKIRDVYTCPLELTHDMIKGKWKPIILWRLRLGPTSLAKLERDIEGISQKMLLQHLKELTDFGFIGKKVYEGYPLKVAYFLTDPQGKSCCPRWRSCRKWASPICWTMAWKASYVRKG